MKYILHQAFGSEDFKSLKDIKDFIKQEVEENIFSITIVDESKQNTDDGYEIGNYDVKFSVVLKRRK